MAHKYQGAFLMRAAFSECNIRRGCRRSSFVRSVKSSTTTTSSVRITGSPGRQIGRDQRAKGGVVHVPSDEREHALFFDVRACAAAHRPRCERRLPVDDGDVPSPSRWLSACWLA